MKGEIEAAIAAACRELFNAKVSVELTRPDEQFGDYATNVALQLGKQLANPPAGGPREIAEKLAEKLRSTLSEQVSNITVAGPGFLNLKLTDQALLQLAQQLPTQSLTKKTVVAEYSDPNPFKLLHAGHVYTTVVGDAIAKLLEAAGATVHRVNFGGDVGLHVGKTMYVILKRLGGEKLEELAKVPEAERSAWMASAYVEGNNIYETDESAKAEIVVLNKKIYELHSSNDRTSPFAQIYWTCRQWSYDSFDEFYTRLGTKLDKYYPESEVAELGLKTVKEHVGNVFVESDGAVIFKGDDHGLHTRVFINSEGLPTYEAKDIGLILQKQKDYHFDRSVVVTGNEQQQYMMVVLKAIEQFLPELAAATIYVPHGMVKLAGGVKMSSRKGNIIPATEVLNITAEANKKAHGKDDEQVVLGAVKYAFLKHRIGGDIIYDPAESVSLEGNSGPYLQYAFARANSILNKSQVSSIKSQVSRFDEAERSLLRKLGEYAEVVDKAVTELMPHHICTYLYELAQTFNSFYEGNRVIGDPREQIRLGLVKTYADTLQKGLELLNISVPDKM